MERQAQMNETGAQPRGTYQALDGVIERLLAPGGCPWDRQQTHQSLKRYLLEECYELMEAIDAGDPKDMLEELGDLLAQVSFHIRLAEEAGTFTAADVFGAAVDKLERRHPHVFGDGEADTPEQVKANWEEIKRQERGESASRLGQVPDYLPALAQAQLIQDRAALAAFDWDRADDVLEKVEEEVRELGDATTDDEREAEMGDVLFSLVNSGRWLGIRMEDSLRGANRRFTRRFVHMERLCAERGVDFAGLTMEEKEALWQEAKRSVG